MQVPLLVLGMLSLMTPLAYAQDQRYQDLVNGFIEEYNRKSGSENLFRLSILNLPPEESNDPAVPRLLRFTIRETVCPKTENRNADECDFKENGLVKECIGTVDLDSSNPSDSISCDGVPGGDLNTEREKKRFGFLNFIRTLLRRVGEKVKTRFIAAIEKLIDTFLP
ncbi:cathelicidin antimicrobial peptide-like [Notamacropus eugenii]|uniref:cathelicidin antimicrobial peptide-like n=1 Tax=Notamacropus eugenii TaxID=9315 RepID=UPI003B66BBAC